MAKDSAPATPGTTVATTPRRDALAEARAAHIADLKERNAHAAAIRGTAWGKDCSDAMVRAVSHYCTIHNLDPARHVEVLGGKIYHTGELYEERGMPLVRAGIVTYSEPLYVHEDPELTRLANSTSEDPELIAWAKAERTRRVQARILRGIPHDVTGACIYTGYVIAENGVRTPIVGFNWCGGATKVKRKSNGETYRGDPVGDAEPTKTAQSRAKRRFWRQVVEANPVAAESIATLQASAKIANVEMEEIAKVEAERESRVTGGTASHPTPMLAPGEDPYEAVSRPVDRIEETVVGPRSATPTPRAERTAEPEASEPEGEVCSLHGVRVSDAQRCPECEREELELAREGRA